MASPPIKPLDGPEGYLRWKESMLLRFHTLRVAHLLSKNPPSGNGASSEAWAREDAICRGHILAALSDRLLPDYARHATARALWDAVARTYDMDTYRDFRDRFEEFCFDAGGHFLEQLAHAEALGFSARFSDDTVADGLRWKLPEVVADDIASASYSESESDKKGMSFVWKIARCSLFAYGPKLIWKTAEEIAMGDLEAQEQGEEFTEAQKQREEFVCWTCGMPGHIARNCSVGGHNARKRGHWA